jgi:putative membrane protein
MMGGYGAGWGMGWFGMIFMLVFWVLVIVAIVYLIRWLAVSSRTGGREGRHWGAQTGGREGRHWGAHEDSSIEILKKRYARGEIDKEEFEEKRKVLES